jgi:hypothetical protein
MYGPKGDEVKEKWRKLHIVDSFNMYYSPNIIMTACGTNKDIGKKG